MGAPEEVVYISKSFFGEVTQDRVVDDQDGRDDGPEEIVQDAATIR